MVDPIVVTLLGIKICIRAGQYANAAFPIVVTVSGIVSDVRLEQPANVDASIFLKPDWNTALVND